MSKKYFVVYLSIYHHDFVFSLGWNREKQKFILWRLVKIFFLFQMETNKVYVLFTLNITSEGDIF